MAVKFNEETKTFTLQTSKSTYKMKVDSYGMLLHTYYGFPTDESDLSYLIAPDDHGFSGQVGEIIDDRTYSMDYFPLEYAVHGNSDFRISALWAGTPWANRSSRLATRAASPAKDSSSRSSLSRMRQSSASVRRLLLRDRSAVAAWSTVSICNSRWADSFSPSRRMVSSS